ncbi:hypothetical protein T265_02718 [Opisthorchis viverrini]|uniref:Uncharacterized protein n=1 Tax=Opisthorchis viverrini TaxID=6198 RepID=A0A075AI27_OPIVI|nr:hypothetical protein T265_02718 [Opisthorchis viverrini]KER30904.1 hypothetical protein T265_02718 [Opisthorchis viverrini]
MRLNNSGDVQISRENCHATRSKHEGWDTAKLTKTRQGKSRDRRRVRTVDLPISLASMTAEPTGKFPSVICIEFPDFVLSQVTRISKTGTFSISKCMLCPNPSNHTTVGGCRIAYCTNSQDALR